MKKIPIQSIPNQFLTASLDGSYYEIIIKETNGVMSVSIKRDGIDVIKSQRAVSGFALIPYKYKESGNFAITTSSFDLPDYKKFGLSQFLIYASQSEIDLYRDGSLTFNTIALTPLRYNRSNTTYSIVDPYTYMMTETGENITTETGDFVVGEPV